MDGSGHVIVHLDDDEWKRACMAGIGRVTENMDRLDSADYALGNNDPEILASCLSAIGEVAVAKHFEIPYDWGMAVWDGNEHNLHRGRVDVGNRFEVRRVKYEDGKVSLRADQVGKNLIVVAVFVPPEGHHHSVKILRWGYHDDLWAHAEWAVFNAKDDRGRRIKKTSTFKKYVAQDAAAFQWCTCFTAKSKHSCAPQQVAAAA
jgi:hypothetical protein